MKMTKRIMAVLLAVFLLAALAVVPASAAVEQEIAITDAVEGDVYHFYQILGMEVNDTTKAFRYTKVDAWWDFITTANNGADSAENYFSVSGNYVDKTSAFVAKDVAAKAKEALGTKTTTLTATVDANGNASIKNLDYGYYLVLVYNKDNNLKANAALASVTPGDTDGVTIQSKNASTVDGLPAVTKEVQEGSVWGETNDAAFGDIVEFKITVTADNGAAGYKLKDTLADGFTLNENSFAVTDEDGAAIDSKYYSIDFSDTTYDFVITFTDEYLATLVANDGIIVTYDAVLNANGTNVTIGGSGNVNKVELDYTGRTEDKSDSTTTYTYRVIVDKVDNNNKALSGAGFTLYEKIGDSYSAVGSEITGVTTFDFSGLDAGEYKLSETTTPKGYVTAKDITFTISATLSTTGADIADVTGATVSDQDGSVKFIVQNTPGTELPSTGGIGTTIFYVVGLVLVLGAVTLLVTKKRAA